MWKLFAETLARHWFVFGRIARQAEMAAVAPNILMIKRALDGARATYRIKKYPRLFLATNGAGGGSWRIRYRPHFGAQQCWLTLSNDARNTDFTVIARKAKELLSRLELDGVDPRSDRPRQGATFDATFEKWLANYAKVYKKSWAGDEAIYKRHIRSRLGAALLDKIDRQDIIAVLDEIATAATPLQANRCQSVISAVYSWALDEGYVKAHPALRIRRRGEERSREMVMTNDQVRAFWTALDDGVFANAAVAIRLLLMTGQRLNEVVGATVTELDLDGDRPQWTIPSARTKNALQHVLPLTPGAVALFREALALRSSGITDHPFVFPARRRDPSALDGNQVSRARLHTRRPDRVWLKNCASWRPIRQSTPPPS